MDKTFGAGCFTRKGCRETDVKHFPVFPCVVKFGARCGDCLGTELRNCSAVSGLEKTDGKSAEADAKDH